MFSSTRDREKRENRPGPIIITSRSETNDPEVTRQKNYLLRSWRNLPRWATVPLERQGTYLVVGKDHDSFQRIQDETGMPLTKSTSIDSPRVKLMFNPRELQKPIPLILWPLKGKLFSELPENVKYHPRVRKPIYYRQGLLQQFILAEEAAHAIDGVSGLISQQDGFTNICRRDIAAQHFLQNPFQQLILGQPENRTHPNEIFARVMAPIILGRKNYVPLSKVMTAEKIAEDKARKRIPSHLPDDCPEVYFDTMRQGYPTVERYIRQQVIPFLKKSIKTNQ